MVKSFIINKYITKDFLKITFIIIFGFLCLSIVMNLFEEINFFKDLEIGVLLPLFISFLVAPNFVYNLLPFVILLSSMWLFLKLIKSDEVIAMRATGLSNFSIIMIPCIIAFFLGIFFVTSINPITAALVEKYETIKGSYNQDKEYLAVITSNGIWIKEKNNNITNIIRSSSLQNDQLKDVTIYRFDNKHNPISRIEASSANIQTTDWILKNVKIFNISEESGEAVLLEKLDYKSIYDLEKIRSVYSNLDTISFWKIREEIEILKERGYSIKDMQGKLQRAISYPFFLAVMVLLAGVFTLGKQYKKNNWVYIFLAIFSSVFIYFCNDFSNALGKTGKLPVELSVWMPVIIVFIFSFVGLIHVNQK